MPTRRRPTQISAAALPASRLPLGTPTLSDTKSPASARTSSYSPSRHQPQAPSSSCGKDDITNTGPVIHTVSTVMAPKNDPEPAHAKSIAEAKLERQKKRIEEADAPMPRKRGSRAKGRQWKPFDFTADTPRSTANYEGGVPVSEVRVNTFRALSRDESSSARSASVLSQRTSETGPSDMERQDSAFTEHGFPVFKARRNWRNVNELNAYEDQPEERQITVEATFDARQIYEVFGNALPGPEFTQEIIGQKDGQVQFIQHPNGDISAQQWSYHRYMWENIGQFSNIRKKVEGQLASDRLKGETAYQKLQQNTLAYFRTVAKQREANAMGLPVGPKEIEAAMPQRRLDDFKSTSVVGKETVKEPRAAEPSQASHETLRKDGKGQNETFTASKLKAAGMPFMPQNTQHISFPNHAYYGPSYGRPSARMEDPFYQASTYQQAYGGKQYMPQHYNQNARAGTASGPFFGVSQQQHGVNYEFNFPQIGQTSSGSRAGNSQYDATNISRPEHQWQQRAPEQATSVIGQRYPQFPALVPHNRGTLTQPSSSYTTATPESAAPQPKPVVHVGNRPSMSDQLWRITATAKERNLSQTNITRTVLYDPYQSQPTGSRSDAHKHPEKPVVSTSGPSFSTNVAGKKLQPPASFDPTSANFFPTVLAPRVAPPPASPVADAVENNLKDSSPDTQWNKKPCDHSTPLITSADDPKRTLQNATDLSISGGGSLNESVTEVRSASQNRKAYDEELQNWWTSGNRFARQEEFFESIKTAHNASNQVTTTSPLAHLTPIGPPSGTPKKSEPTNFNQTTTRLLIPVLENLSSYVQGPMEKRRDYFSQWSPAPEWCIDRSEGGNNSFFDSDWGQPPARVGRDPRYQNRSWDAEQTRRGNRFPSGGSCATAVGSGIDRRFNFGGRY